MKPRLCLILLVAAVHSQADGAPASTVTGLVGGQVILPCIYTKRATASPANIRVYWQTPSHHVAYVFDDGRSKPANQDERYRDRTMVSQGQVEKGNLSLHIRNLTVADEHLYTCLVFTKHPELKKIRECKVNLKIAAHFSIPVLSQEEDVRPGGEVNLTCRSSGGYPEPTGVDWTDGGGNSLHENGPVTRKESDPVTGLWNVTSVLLVNATINYTITCSVDNYQTQETRTSAVWMSPSSDPKPQMEDPGPADLTAVYVLVAVFGIAAVLIAIICWVKRRERYFGVPPEDGTENHTGAGNSSAETQKL